MGFLAFVNLKRARDIWTGNVFPLKMFYIFLLVDPEYLSWSKTICP